MMFEVGRGKRCEVKLAVGRSLDKDLRRSRPPKKLTCLVTMPSASIRGAHVFKRRILAGYKRPSMWLAFISVSRVLFSAHDPTELGYY